METAGLPDLRLSKALAQAFFYFEEKADYNRVVEVLDAVDLISIIASEEKNHQSTAAAKIYCEACQHMYASLH